MEVPLGNSPWCDNEFGMPVSNPYYEGSLL